MNGQWS